MPSVDLIDETFIVVTPRRLAVEVARQEQWARWWPDLQLQVFMDRGLQGIRWSVTGALVGSSEIWLEPMLDGVLLHYYLRADHPAALPQRRVDAIRRQRARRWKQHAWQLKTLLEGERRPGCPRSDPGPQE